MKGGEPTAPEEEHLTRQEPPAYSQNVDQPPSYDEIIHGPGPQGYGPQGYGSGYGPQGYAPGYGPQGHVPGHGPQGHGQYPGGAPYPGHGSAYPSGAGAAGYSYPPPQGAASYPPPRGAAGYPPPPHPLEKDAGGEPYKSGYAELDGPAPKPHPTASPAVPSAPQPQPTTTQVPTTQVIVRESTVRVPAKSNWFDEFIDDVIDNECKSQCLIAWSACNTLMCCVCFGLCALMSSVWSGNARTRDSQHQWAKAACVLNILAVSTGTILMSTVVIIAFTAHKAVNCTIDLNHTVFYEVVAQEKCHGNFSLLYD